MNLNEDIEASTDIEAPTDNYKLKKNLIFSEIEKMKNQKQAHYDLYKKYKFINTILKLIINVLNAVSVSSLVMEYASLYGFTNLVAMITTTISSVITIVINNFSLDDKINRHQLAKSQLTDLYRQTTLIVLKNNLSSSDLDTIIENINSQLSLINDTAPPI